MTLVAHYILFSPNILIYLLHLVCAIIKYLRGIHNYIFQNKSAVNVSLVRSDWCLHTFNQIKNLPQSLQCTLPDQICMVVRKLHPYPGNTISAFLQDKPSVLWHLRLLNI